MGVAVGKAHFSFDTILFMITKAKTLSFLWQHLLLLGSLYLMTLGVVLCVKSGLGSSVISSLPFVFSLAGPVSIVPQWTIGEYTIAMNALLVLCQILILRRKFEPMQLFQLVIGFIFGWLIDLNMALTSGLACTTLPSQLLTQLAGCTVMGIGIAFDCNIEVVLEEGYALQFNDSDMIDLVNKAVTAAGGKTEFIDKPFSGSEDFSFFGKLTGTPSAFMMVDAGRGENAVSLHNGKIVFDENVMRSGVAGMSAVALKYLAE